MNNQVLFSPFPVLVTERLKLRCADLEDVEIIANLRANKQNAKYLQRGTIVDVDATKQWLEKILRFAKENISILWVLEDKVSAQLLGTICLWNFSDDKFTAEVGYDLFPEFQGQGFMSEALQAVVAFGKQIRLHTIEAFTHQNNSSSLQLLKANNFLWQPERKDEDVPTNVIYTLALNSKK